VAEDSVTYEVIPPVPPTRRAAIFFLGEDILARLIGLPDGWTVTGVRDDFARNGILIRITGPTAPEAIAGVEPYSFQPELEYEAPSPEERAAHPTAAGTVRVILPDWLLEGNDKPWLHPGIQP
jgi:hypothetical protein